jgi:hypothetical protein
MQSQPVSFYSEGVQLRGDLFLPDGLAAGEQHLPVGVQSANQPASHCQPITEGGTP